MKTFRWKVIFTNFVLNGWKGCKTCLCKKKIKLNIVTIHFIDGYNWNLYIVTSNGHKLHFNEHWRFYLLHVLLDDKDLFECKHVSKWREIQVLWVQNYFLNFRVCKNLGGKWKGKSITTLMSQGCTTFGFCLLGNVCVKLRNLTT